MWDDHGRLDRRCATIGAPAGGRCAAAVFPRSRPCRRGFSGSLLRALKNWPHNGPPRDPTAWLILVGRNVALDDVRRSSKSEPLPADDKISDLDDAETDLAERLDSSHYRDDVLRLLFICCHPDLPAVQQIALALRVISGLTVKEIARAFLVSESAMEQRITRAKGRVSRADVPFETPGAVERAARLGAVAAMIYPVFNEGYSASGGSVHVRAPLCEEAIRLSRLLLTLFPSEPEIMGLTALVLLQHARTPARLDADGAIVLLQDQDRRLWDRDKIAEGLALIEKAVRHRRRQNHRTPIGRRSINFTRRWSGSSRRPLLRSIAPLPSARCRVRRPPWRWWNRWRSRWPAISIFSA
jgi:RNA polymerase sigma-70 factor (ECF subfamily)